MLFSILKQHLWYQWILLNLEILNNVKNASKIWRKLLKLKEMQLNKTIVKYVFLSRHNYYKFICMNVLTIGQPVLYPGNTLNNSWNMLFCDLRLINVIVLGIINYVEIKRLIYRPENAISSRKGVNEGVKIKTKLR